MLIGRKHETSILKGVLRTNKAELIAVYGRRRVGKTFLIRQVFASHICFEFSGLHNGTLSDQLENFTNQLIFRNKKKKNFSQPKGWLEAFSMLSDHLNLLKSKKKKVIFIDEFPWLVTPRSKFLMSFENFWNSYASKRTDLAVVICGSAASYMVKKIINNKGGLHHRITQQIRLLPFTLHETELFLRSKNINYSHYDILQLYMSIGGIPYYLENIKRGESVAHSLDRMCFTKDGILNNEFHLVFSSLFENFERHIAIVKALSSVRKGLTRNHLSQKSKIISGGTLTSTLQELIESGFISQYYPFGKKSKETLYRLSDEYSMFYLKFIQGNRATGSGVWKTLFNSRSFISWSGFSFETICLKHIEQIKNGLGISAIHSNTSSWVGKSTNSGAQIDLLIDRDDNIINLCEMKFANDLFTVSKKYAGELRSKAGTFKSATNTRKNIFITMITTFGIKENSYSLEIIDNSLNADILFKA